MIVTLQDVQLVGVQLPNQPVMIGLSHQGKGYYFESFKWMDRSAALEQFRHRLDNPPSFTEGLLLLETPSGLRLCIHEPDIVVMSYGQALASLCLQMRNSGQVKISDNQWGLRTYKKTFTGSEAVSWLSSHLHISRAEAVELGQSCLENGCFNHVLGEQSFRDELLFYRFKQDGDPESRVFRLN